jgi:MFS family permease
MKRITYRNYLLTILSVILAFNSVDRLALGLVLQDIKGDLHLSDTQLGLLSGIAFALFYSVMGIPIARWADRSNRATIIAITTALWSAAVAVCGLAGSFVQLMLIRIGVAVGEAGCVPPAHSLIADYFARAERPRAVALYMQGASLSVVVGYFLAGWLNQFYGLRVMFAVLGLPGIALAVTSWLTVTEPRSRECQAGVARAVTCELRQEAPAPASSTPQLAAVCTTLWANRTFRHLVLSYSVVYFFGYGILQWQPAFFVRSFGLETGELGSWFTLICGVGGVLGTYCGGEIASRYATNNERLQLTGMAVANVAFGALWALIYGCSNKYVAFALMGLASIMGATASAPLFSIIQTLVPPRMRATSIAIVYLFANLIGMGLGPLAAGALSDALRPLFGDESLRYALLALCPGYLWGGWHLWCASKTITRDLAVVEGDSKQRVSVGYPAAASAGAMASR